MSDLIPLSECKEGDIVLFQYGHELYVVIVSSINVVEGVRGGSAFLCGNRLAGSSCEDKKGMKYSYWTPLSVKVRRSTITLDKFTQLEEALHKWSLKTKLIRAEKAKIRARIDYVTNIEKYFKRRTKAVLYFNSSLNTKEILDKEINSELASFISHYYPNIGEVETLVLKALLLSRRYRSVNGGGTTETTRGRRRSAGDLWRHCKLWEPELSIFQVIQALHTIAMKRSYYGCMYCSTVRKIVFFEHSSNVFNSQGTKDEFGNLVILWGDSIELSEEHEKRMEVQE